MCFIHYLNFHIWQGKRESDLYENVWCPKSQRIVHQIEIPKISGIDLKMRYIDSKVIKWYGVYGAKWKALKLSYDTRYVSYHVQKVSYPKYSWIVWYIGAYRMNHIAAVNCTYRTIHRHVSLNWVFLLKFVVLFDLNKLLSLFLKKKKKKIIGKLNWV